MIERGETESGESLLPRTFTHDRGYGGNENEKDSKQSTNIYRQHLAVTVLIVICRVCLHGRLLVDALNCTKKRRSGLTFNRSGVRKVTHAEQVTISWSEHSNVVQASTAHGQNTPAEPGTRNATECRNNNNLQPIKLLLCGRLHKFYWTNFCTQIVEQGEHQQGHSRLGFGR
jgi:hypothetical protein